MSYQFFEHVLGVISSLVTDTPAGLIRVLRSFKKKEGYLFPHRRLGFSTPEEFLRESEEFTMFKRGRDDYICARRVPSKRTRDERIQALYRRSLYVKIVAKRGPGRSRG